MDMNILKYLAFIRTVECESFTKAAQLLNYSQSGISRMIADLEKEWSVQLLERKRNGVRLTSDGLKLLPYAKSLCESYQKLQMQIDDLNGLQSGLIRIGVVAGIATNWIPNIFAEFQKQFPSIDYELKLGLDTDIENWINDGEVDCGFLTLPTTPSFETEFLEQDRLLVVLPKNHPMAIYDKFPVRALADYPFILFEKDEKTEISEIFNRSGIRPNIHIRTVDDYAIISMVEKGLGISILPELILKRTSHKIITRELDIPAYRNLGFAVKNKKILPLAVKKFSEFLNFRNS